MRPFFVISKHCSNHNFCLVISSIQLGTRKKFPFKQPVIKLSREHVYTIRTVKANQEVEGEGKCSKDSIDEGSKRQLFTSSFHLPDDGSGWLSAIIKVLLQKEKLSSV